LILCVLVSIASASQSAVGGSASLKPVRPHDWSTTSGARRVGDLRHPAMSAAMPADVGEIDERGAGVGRVAQGGGERVRRDGG
jgi:hypothetical protein